MAKVVSKTYNELKEVKYCKKTATIDNKDITYNELRLYVTPNEYVVVKVGSKDIRGKSTIKTLIENGCILHDTK